MVPVKVSKASAKVPRYRSRYLEVAVEPRKC